MRNSELPSVRDLDRLSYDILKQSKSFGIFPTPVDRIVEYAELKVDYKNGIHTIPNNYISKKIDHLKSSLAKIFGALDRREKTVYLNPDILPVKKNFVKLHETGHHCIPWQRAVFEYVDDEKTLSLDVQETFEAEANYFASAVLFQTNRFEELARTLPLEIKSILYLGKHFGASVHATMRRYVETSHKNCALIVLTKGEGFKNILSKRNCFQSISFTREFGNLSYPENFDAEFPFVQDFILGRRFIEKPKSLQLVLEKTIYDFEYQYFSNGYNIFVFITPPSEIIKSKVSILLSSQ